MPIRPRAIARFATNANRLARRHRSPATPGRRAPVPCWPRVAAPRRDTLWPARRPIAATPAPPVRRGIPAPRPARNSK